MEYRYFVSRRYKPANEPGANKSSTSDNQYIPLLLVGAPTNFASLHGECWCEPILRSLVLFFIYIIYLGKK